MEDGPPPDGPHEGENVETAGGVPRWVTAGVIILILAILGVGAALASSVFTKPQQTRRTASERDIAWYQNQVARNPQDVQAHSSLGQAYLAAGENAEALKEAEKLIEMQPKDLRGYYIEGNAFRRMGKYDEAVKAYDEVLRLVPTEAEAMYQKSLAYQAKGDLASARTSLEGAVKLSPLASDLRVALGALLEKSGEKLEAIAQYKEAIRYVPDYAPALEALKRLGAAG